MGQNLEKGFFEFIAAADAEKVHSQTIGWIFSKNCNVLDDEDKNSILQQLIFKKISSDINFDPIKVDVEINDIDILIECKNHLIVIENKVKSSQHSNQLLKYEYLTTQDETIAEAIRIRYESDGKKLNHNQRLNSKNKKPYYIYLTLIEEIPNGTIDRWISVSYLELYDLLNQSLKEKTFDNFENYSIVKSYLRTIGNLVSALNYVVDNVNVRTWVFENGNFSKRNINKSDFIDQSNIIQYIGSTGLVRFMQNYYYIRVCNELGGLNKEVTIQGIKVRCTAEFSPSNGSGFIQIYFSDSVFKYGKYEFIFGYQIQLNTVKFNCASTDYNSSNYNQLPKDIELKFSKYLVSSRNTELKTPFKSLQQKKKDEAKGKAKAYISVTKNFNSGKDLTNMRPIELANFIKSELPQIYIVAMDMKKSYEKSPLQI